MRRLGVVRCLGVFLGIGAGLVSFVPVEARAGLGGFDDLLAAARDDIHVADEAERASTAESWHAVLDSAIQAEVDPWRRLTGLDAMARIFLEADHISGACSAWTTVAHSCLEADVDSEPAFVDLGLAAAEAAMIYAAWAPGSVGDRLALVDRLTDLVATTPRDGIEAWSRRRRVANGSRAVRAGVLLHAASVLLDLPISSMPPHLAAGVRGNWGAGTVSMSGHAAVVAAAGLRRDAADEFESAWDAAPAEARRPEWLANAIESRLAAASGWAEAGRPAAANRARASAIRTLGRLVDVAPFCASAHAGLRAIVEHDLAAGLDPMDVADFAGRIAARLEPGHGTLNVLTEAGLQLSRAHGTFGSDPAAANAFFDLAMRWQPQWYPDAAREHVSFQWSAIESARNAVGLGHLDDARRRLATLRGVEIESPLLSERLAGTWIELGRGIARGDTAESAGAMTPGVPPGSPDSERRPADRRSRAPAAATGMTGAATSAAEHPPSGSIGSVLATDARRPARSTPAAEERSGGAVGHRRSGGSSIGGAFGAAIGVTTLVVLGGAVMSLRAGSDR